MWLICAGAGAAVRRLQVLLLCVTQLAKISNLSNMFDETVSETVSKKGRGTDKNK